MLVEAVALLLVREPLERVVLAGAERGVNQEALMALLELQTQAVAAVVG
jgi:hypothetical protein